MHAARPFALLCVALLAGCGPAAPDAAAPADPLERARVLRERGEFGEADDALTAALADSPGEARAAELYLERGVTRERLDRPADAEADYTAALDREPANVRALNNRAAVRAQSGRMTEALADWDAALAADPDDRLSLANRALARQETGDYDGALADAAAAETLAPGSFGPAHRKGAILLARGDAAGALAALEDAQRRADGEAAAGEVDAAAFAPAWRDAAAALRRLNRPKEAAEAWAGAVRRDPRLAATPEATAAAALAAAVDALEQAGFAPAAAPAPAGFDLLVTGGGNETVPVLLAEPAAGGAFVLSGEDLSLLNAAPAAWVAVPTDGGAALHRAAAALARGARPVRFLVPPPAGGDAPSVRSAPAPAPLPVEG